MTGTRDPQQDDSIEAMLRDSGLEAAGELRGTLEGLQALVPDEAPAPRADLAALLAAGTAAAPGPADDLRPWHAAVGLPAGVSSLAERSRGRKRRVAVVTGAVVAAMSLGAGAVAASSQDFRSDVGHTIGVIFRPATPVRTTAPAGPTPSDLPAAPAIPEPAPAVPVPAPARTAPAGTAPAAASPAHPSPTETLPAAKPRGRAATPPAAGRGGSLPTPDRRPVRPGAGGGKNRRAVPGPLPTIPTLPGPPAPGPHLPPVTRTAP